MIFGAQNMDWNTYVTQWKVIVRRNLLLKKRNVSRLIVAFILPFSMHVFVFNQSNETYIKPSEMIGVDYYLPLIYLNQSLKGVSNNFHLCVAPRDIEENFLNSIQASLSLYGQKRTVRITQFEHKDHLNERLLKRDQHNEPDCDAGVTFVGNISTNGTYIVRVPDDTCSPVLDKYCSNGILSNIQQAVDNAFLQKWSGNSSFKLPSAKIHGFVDPHKAARNTMYQIVRLLLLLVCLPIIATVAENASFEKYMMIKESMFVMGTKSFSYWSAWLFCEILLIIYVAVLICLALFTAKLCSVIAILLHFLLWFGFGCTLVVCVMTLMRFYPKPQVSNILSVYILLSAIASDILHPNGRHGDITLIDCFAMLSSPYAYEKGFDKIVRENDFYGASTAILMIFVDLFLYSLLDFILEYRFPYGITRRSPWRKLKPNGKNSESTKCEDAHEKKALIGSLSSSTNLDPYIKLEKIRKVYSWRFKSYLVLDEVTFSVFKGEVVCLMGHNGAGKSTLLKIISRSLKPDDGKITNATSINFGVCPQENILHHELTVYEQLQFFGSLKGIPYLKLDLTVTTLLESFDLLNERDTRSRMLSEGQKRTLCVAIAMIGDPEVLLLDEPSSGMSQQFRRQLWNILQDYTKSGRSVLFTTHDMDEAELFSDRIALLYYGKLIYYGTTMDIKKQFGGGYNVRITLQSEPSLRSKSELVRFINDFPSKPEMILKSDCEIVVKLHSFDAATCSDLLRKIEEQFKDLGSDCFTFSVSSLEEIFFLLTDKNTKRISEEKKTALQNETTIPKFTYISSTWTSIKVLIRARCRLLLRKLFMLFPIMLCAAVLAAHGILHHVPKQTFYIGPKLYENEILHVINASGKPLTEFEKSLSKLRMKFELVNSAVSVGEKNFMETEIQNCNPFKERLEFNWNWSTYLRSPFTLPVLQNLMSNILWKTFDDKLGRRLKIIVQPITIFEENSASILSETHVTLILIGIFLIFVAVGLGLEVVKEKARKVIWLLSRTRNNALPYWVSTFVVQLALLTLSLLMLQNLMLIFGVQAFQKFSLWIAFYLSLPGCLLTVYLMVQCVEICPRAERLMIALIVTVSMLMYTVFLIAIVADIPYIYILNTLALFIFPIYAPFGLVILLSEGRTVDSVIYGTHWKIVCGLIIPLSNLLYALLIIYLGKWKTFKIKEKIQVMNQEPRDKEHNPKSILELKSVRMLYRHQRASKQSPKTKHAVAIKDLSMSFLEGEIYAILCSNRTEKSALMELLSLNVGWKSGEISIRDKYMESISYCPEKNIVWFDLTVEEQLLLFAILNGVPIMYADKVVDSVMKDLLLKKVANRRAGYLSIGSQRKLSVALSLLGNSNLVVLDEPTTGMDPVSKHFLWKKLHREFPTTSERTLILTTKSSNEAEDNCTRIGLITDGNLRCFGTTEAIKNEFGKGFQLNVKMKTGDDKKLNSYLVSEIPEALEISHKGVMLQYYIPRQAFKSMSGLFTAVAKIQAFEGVENCIISECPLNQIILEILSQANTQVTGEDEYTV